MFFKITQLYYFRLLWNNLFNTRRFLNIKFNEDLSSLKIRKHQSKTFVRCFTKVDFIKKTSNNNDKARNNLNNYHFIKILKIKSIIIFDAIYNSFVNEFKFKKGWKIKI
jgi:hypothetical protein